MVFLLKLKFANVSMFPGPHGSTLNCDKMFSLLINLELIYVDNVLIIQNIKMSTKKKRQLL